MRRISKTRAHYVVPASMVIAAVWIALLWPGGAGSTAVEGQARDATAETAYLPYYDLSLDALLERPHEFTERLAESLARAERSLQASTTTEASCVSPAGQESVTTISECNRRPGHTVQEPPENSGIGIGVDLSRLPVARVGQRERPDSELAPRERALERQFAMSGIARKEYVRHTHDCDDFAFRAFHWLRRFYGDAVSVKWYAYTNAAGRRVGHALNDIHWEDGTVTYLEPQTGQVVELPEPRVQTFQSRDVEEVNAAQAAETERERGLPPGQ